MGRKLYAKGEGFNPSTSIEDVEGLREELDALKKGSGGGDGDNTTIERRLATAEGEIDDLQRDVAEQSEEVAAVGAQVNTLQGTDTGKSVRAIAAEETAKIVGNAPANYDTLKEIADYIATDATGAAELSNKVNKNTTDIAKVAEDLSATHQLASNAESAISEVVELIIPAIESDVANKATKSEAQGYATTAKSEAIAAAAADAQNKANTAESNANDYTDGAVDDLAKGQVATNKANIASLQTAQTSLSATVKTNTNNITTHTQQIANLDSNKLGKTEKAADSAKADYAASAGTATNASQLGGVAASGYAQLSGAQFTGDSAVQGVFRANAAADHRNCLAILAEIATGVNQGIAHIGTNYGFSNMSTSFTQNIIYAMSIYRGMVGIGRSFTYAELNAAYKDGRPLTVAGNAVITGTMTATATYHSSDERLKTFEGDVEVDLEKLKALPKKYFHWTADADGKRQLGTSAQAVEEVFPELVSTNADGYKSVNYANLSVVALAAIDNLTEQNAELERRLAKIEKLLNIE